MNTFIVDLWASIFKILSWVSLFRLVRKLVRSTRGSWKFVDAWVLSHTILALVCVFLLSKTSSGLVRTIIIIYGLLRLTELVVYQINVAFFDEYRARKAKRDYAIRGYRRLTILTLHNYLEVAFWFAAIYEAFPSSFKPESTLNLGIPLRALGHSLYTMTTFGIPLYHPVDNLGTLVVIGEAVVGLFMAVIVIARTLSLIPTPRTLDKFERPES